MTLAQITLGILILSSGIALITNILYPQLNARDAKLLLAKDAKNLLTPEIAENLKIIEAYKHFSGNNRVPLDDFNVAAWETISKGGLLIGLPSDEINRVLEAYTLVNRANALHARMLEIDTRPPVPYMEVIYRDDILKHLVDTVSNLEIVLKDLSHKNDK